MASVSWTWGRLRLHPLAEPLPGVIRNWFNQDLKVTIPAQDADRFQLMYLPFLAQKGLVAPGSWNSEELPQPGLTLQLTHEPGHRLLLSWGFRYTSQTAATSVPFRPRRGDFFRDLPAEHALEAAAAKLAGDFPALLESHREKLLPTAALSHADAARFITETLPLLEASGVAVTQLGEVLEYSRAAEPPGDRSQHRGHRRPRLVQPADPGHRGRAGGAIRTALPGAGRR